jgi:cytochrome b561
MGNELPWINILAAVGIAVLLIFIGPSLWRMAKESPKGSAQDWLGFLLPVGGVVLFILLLIAMLQG